MGHHGGVVESLIAEMRNSVSGELTSRNQIVDHLLDLRLDARSDAAVVAVVDALLADLPGRTTVPNTWWLGGLADIERAVRLVPAATAAPGPDVTPLTPSMPSDHGSVATPPPLPRRRRTR